MGVKISEEDRDLYNELARTLHSLGFTLTTKFFEDKESRKQIVDDLHVFAVAMATKNGCGSLCPDKERGCVACLYGVSVPKR
jgi:hypothetical protein